MKINPVIVTLSGQVKSLDSLPQTTNRNWISQENDVVVEEIDKKKRRTQERYCAFSNIIFDKQTSDNAIPCHIGIYGLAGTIVGIILNSPLALIPITNIIEHPSYFYEEMVINFCSLPVWTAQFMISCIYYMNVDCIKTWKHFMIATFYLLLQLIFQRLIVYFIWTEAANYPYPMPFHTTLSRFVTILFGFIVVWRLFDLQWRKSKRFQKRFFFFLLSYLMIFFIHAQYSFWGTVFTRMPPKYQWIFSLTLPVIREFDIWIFCKSTYKAAGAMDPSVEIASSFCINVRHGIFLSVMLGTAATDLSCWIIFGTDFMINMFMALNLIWIRKKGNPEYEDRNVRKMVDLLISITLNEFVELMVTIAFFISFLMCYYGPNAELMGNIKSDYFQHIPVSDIDLFYENVALFLGVELVTIFVSVTVLWIFCRINMLRAYLLLQKEFWVMMTVYLAYTIYLVSFTLYLSDDI